MKPAATLPSFIGQRGAALVVSMMMLVAITLVGVAVMGNSRLEWLMATNSNLQASVLPRAQKTLVDAENWLTALVVCNATPCNSRNTNWDNTPDALFNNVSGTDPLPVNPRVVASWNGLASNNATDSAGNIIGRYIVVYQGCAFFPPGAVVQPGTVCGDNGTPFTDTYEIWALSADANGAARIVRSTFITTTTFSVVTGTSTWRRIGYSEISS